MLRVSQVRAAIEISSGRDLARYHRGQLRRKVSKEEKKDFNLFPSKSSFSLSLSIVARLASHRLESHSRCASEPLFVSDLDLNLNLKIPCQTHTSADRLTTSDKLAYLAALPSPGCFADHAAGSKRAQARARCQRMLLAGSLGPSSTSDR